MYSRRRDPLGCQAAAYRFTGILFAGALLIWIIGRALDWLLRAFGL